MRFHASRELVAQSWFSSSKLLITWMYRISWISKTCLLSNV